MLDACSGWIDCDVFITTVVAVFTAILLLAATNGEQG